MRSILLALFLFFSCTSVFAGTYGDRLIEYYDFQVRQYGSSWYWSWRDPSTGQLKFNVYTGWASPNKEILDSKPVLVSYYPDGRALIWYYNDVPSLNISSYSGYTEEILKANGLATISNIADPLSAKVLADYGLLDIHPDEYDPSAHPIPDGIVVGDESDLVIYDYRGRLDALISLILTILAVNGFAVGLFLWRLFVLTKSQRNIL